MKSKLSIILGVILAVTGALLVWHSLRAPPDRVLAGKNKIRFQLQWVNQAQFAGFYVAQAKHYYHAEGLEVELIAGAFNVNPIAKVISREADIGMATGDQVLQRSADGMRLKAIGTIFDHSVACFVTLAANNLSKPEDLRGKRVAVFPSYDTDNLLRVLLKRSGIPESAVTVRGASGNTAQLINGEVDAYGAYLFNEPLELRRMGHAVQLITPEQKNVRFYSDTLITTPEFLRDNRDLVVKFLRASRRGWEYARAHPDEAVNLMFQLNPGMAVDNANIEGQREMARTVVENLQRSGARPLFSMEPTRWEDMARALIEVNRLAADFLPKIPEICDYSVAEDAK